MTPETYYSARDRLRQYELLDREAKELEEAKAFLSRGDGVLLTRHQHAPPLALPVFVERLMRRSLEVTIDDRLVQIGIEQEQLSLP